MRERLTWDRAVDVVVERLVAVQWRAVRLGATFPSPPAANPTAVQPRMLLSHALLQEGLDWPAAQRALQEVLALAPEHGEAQHNLAVLRHLQSQSLSA
jgi:hypothetical protein